MITPARLPRLRDQMAAQLTDGPEHDDDVPRRIRETTARHLCGGLYWASADMTALAVAAGRALDSVRFASEDRIAPMGLLVAAGGFGQYTSVDGLVLPVDAVSWGPGPAADDGSPTLLCTTWTSRERVIAALTARGSSTGRVDDACALVDGYFQGIRITVEEFPAAELPAQLATVLRTLYAAWHLMTQMTIADPQIVAAHPKVVRAYRRAGRPDPEVTIVQLRRAYRPREQDAIDSDGRTHRWW